MSAELLLYVIMAIVGLEFLSERWLESLNAKYFKRPVPEELKDVFDETEYQKSVKYKLEKYRFGKIQSWLSFIIILLALWFGGFGWLDDFVKNITENSIYQSLLFFGILFGVSFIVSLPFDYYFTFVIEEKFGFNKSTLSLFIKDKIKSFLLALILGGLVGYVLIWLYDKLGPDFWIPAWIFMTLFSLVLTMFYSDVIVPLFNKQTPLEAGELRDRLEDLARRAGFRLKDIYVIDSSKRSTKANAYFSGLGPRKRIVLYDTLIEDLSPEEITAVLAHEIGHYKKKHILIQFVVSTLFTGLMLYLLSVALQSDVLARAFGAERASFHIGMIAFLLLYSPFSMITSLITNVLSRRFEFQADAFAKRFGFENELISALKKLSRKSLSNLTPHPRYVFFHYSHPPLIERIKHLKK